MQKHGVSQCSSLTWRFRGDYGGVAALPIVNLSALQPQVQGYRTKAVFLATFIPMFLQAAGHQKHLGKIIDPFSAEILLQGHL